MYEECDENNNKKGGGGGMQEGQIPQNALSIMF